MSTIIELHVATPNGGATWDEFNEMWRSGVGEISSDLAIFFTTDEVHVPRRVVPSDLTPANLTTRRLVCKTSRDERIIKYSSGEELTANLTTRRLVCKASRDERIIKNSSGEEFNIMSSDPVMLRASASSEDATEVAMPSTALTTASTIVVRDSCETWNTGIIIWLHAMVISLVSVLEFYTSLEYSPIVAILISASLCYIKSSILEFYANLECSTKVVYVVVGVGRNASTDQTTVETMPTVSASTGNHQCSTTIDISSTSQTFFRWTSQEELTANLTTRQLVCESSRNETISLFCLFPIKMESIDSITSQTFFKWTSHEVPMPTTLPNISTNKCNISNKCRGACETRQTGLHADRSPLKCKIQITTFALPGMQNNTLTLPGMHPTTFIVPVLSTVRELGVYTNAFSSSYQATSLHKNVSKVQTSSKRPPPFPPPIISISSPGKLGVYLAGQLGVYLAGELGVYPRMSFHTKSSTEAELLGLSDSANQGIFMKIFIIALGHAIGPLVIYQDNMPCMALIERGRSAAERTRHIAIRFFWISERVSSKDVEIVHKPSLQLYANLLTKPLQGPQFLLERQGLTNW
jgi:hypothetical protein